jgi:integrase
MALSDTTIRAAKAGDTTIKLSDTNGLQLWIPTNGSKLWRYAYRFDNKQKVLALGAYPEIGLAAAREKRNAAKELLASGIDPSKQRQTDKLAKLETSGNTFEVIAKELLDKKQREGRTASTLKKFAWLMSLAHPTLGSRPITEITASEILLVLKRIELSGRIESAGKLRGSIGDVFRYAIATARAINDPTFALRGALTVHKPTHRAAITNPQELGGLMRAIDGFEGQPSTNAALKLMAYLFPRPSELRLAEWKEFDFEKREWTIPASRTKMRREHKMPLPAQAIAILEQLKQITGQHKLVFVGIRTMNRAISENTMNAALRRMGYSQEQMTSHGFRATASTLLNESGKFSVDCIERALAHQDSDAVRRAYARGKHWDERVIMAQYWADYLDTLRDGAKVISIKRA